MNPPSALAGAMNRERKPFTYTPGGLDLSEIKSERMAKRLMRNAMNQGVPETPAHTVQSPPASSTPIVMPNYNCLPVQVFPTFTLPENPKTLLRTRSNPDPNEKLINTSEKPSAKVSNFNKVIGNNNTLPPKYDYNNANSLFYTTPVNYGSSGYTAPILERSDENAQLENTARQDYTQTNFGVEKSNINEYIRPVYFNVPAEIPNIKTDYSSNNATINIPLENIEQTNAKKEEVVIKKAASKSDDIAVNKNGDTNAAITLKLPTKKSEAKTETKVEVVKKTLPDGATQEVKTTTTKTTIDGRTEITTETETTTFPKDDGEDVEYEVEEEEEESSETEITQSNGTEQITDAGTENIEKTAVKTINGKKEDEDEEDIQKNKDEPAKNDSQIITQDEKHESSTTKKVVIIQSETQNSDEENEEEYDDVDEPDDVDVEEVVTLKQTTTLNGSENQNDEIIQNTKGKIEIEDNNNIIDSKTENIEPKQNGQDGFEINGEEEEEEEEDNEKCEQVNNIKKEPDDEPEAEQLDEGGEEEEYEEAEEAEEDEKVKTVLEDKISEQSVDTNQEENKETEKEDQTELKVDKAEDDIRTDVKEIPIKVITEKESEIKESKQENEEVKSESKSLPSSINIPLREPSIPLDKVEEVEIKPIGPAKEVITKTHTEIITTTTDKPVGMHSTQTEYNVVENIVTVNRTTKTLDHAYEEIPDNIPTIKTFEPPILDRNLVSPQPVFRPYQSVFTPEPQTERRHSLLLERISVDRQLPSENNQNNYQSFNQTYEDRHYLQEPQSEILTVSNVKPSTISKNQQWYQRNETDNVSYSNTVPSTDIYSNQQQWQHTQPQQKLQTQSQPFYQPKPPTQPSVQTIYQPQQRVQPSPQPIYQAPPSVQQTPQTFYQPKPQIQPIYQPQPQVQPTSQPIYQTQPIVRPTAQPVYHPQPQYQQNYLDNLSQETYKSSTNKIEQTAYPSYASKPIWTAKTVDSQPIQNTQSNQYSYLQNDSSESFQKSTQHYSSSYVPPPWEQDSNYAVDNSTQSFYQPPPPKTTFTPSKEWKPAQPTSKFSKKTPTAYIPPAPNQSFVVPVNTGEPPKHQGRKTYYSEYERRYISVPETTYIPRETKVQPQPDPSPQYYYDNNEPTEVVEPQWRKELREFKEQTSIQTEQTTVRPPWEEDPIYAKPKDFTPTPTWTQTLKPRSWRERSFEPEYIGSQEWPKTNTLGRGRPQSSYVKNSFDRVPDRTRGVSVDRYNPNNYQSPLTREHPPPASHILDPIIQGKTYHNPNVPAYHSRASAEPREQSITYQQPRHKESRATPVQSRSFKYLQWITGTDD